MSNSLHRLRILNTRPQAQAKKLTHAIQAAGGVVLELPLLEIKESPAWLDTLPALNTIQYAIFISANAVEFCFRQLYAAGIHWPASIAVIAIGQGSANALHKFSVPISAIPDQADSEHLLAMACWHQCQGKNILLIKGEGGLPLIEETLCQRGAQVIPLKVYQRMMPKINPRFIKSIWHDNLVDIILLTSEQSMHHLYQLFEQDAHDWLRGKTYLVISERLAQLATSMGMNNLIRCHPEGMMDALLNYVTKD